MNRRFSRRTFLAASAVGLASRPSRAAARLNVERLRVGIVGCGFRGKYLIGNLPDAAQVVALCDCALPRVELTRNPQGDFTEVLGEFAAGDGRTVAVFQDYRKLLDETKLDALIIATPDHHHVGMALAALARGLDIYVEKPLTLTIAEGRKLVEAAKRMKRVVQVGSQQRTMAVNRAACEFVRNGGLGKVTLVELPNYPGPMNCHNGIQSAPVNRGFDWDLFCGPAPLRPHHPTLWVKDEMTMLEGDRLLLWRGWDLWRDYSGHMMTNWGAHSVDMVQMALGRDADGPVDIRPEPELIGPETDRPWLSKTPAIDDSVALDDDRIRFSPVTMRYADGTELRFRNGDGEAVYHGERGKLFMRRNKARTDPPELFAPQIDPAEITQWDGVGHVARPHLQNWIDCITTRSTPNAPLEVGHRTATVCHLANIARQLSRPLKWNPQAEHFVNDAEADVLLDRPRREGWELPNV